MTFPIKKRINTQLFIDRNKGFRYKTVKPNEEAEQKREINNGSIKITNFLEEGKTETAGKVKAGMKTMAACLE